MAALIAFTALIVYAFWRIHNYYNKLTKGNLPVQLSKLEGAGLIEIRKGFVKKKPVTTAKLTAKGAKTLAVDWMEMDEIRRRANGLGRFRDSN